MCRVESSVSFFLRMENTKKGKVFFSVEITNTFVEHLLAQTLVEDAPGLDVVEVLNLEVIVAQEHVGVVNSLFNGFCVVKIELSEVETLRLKISQFDFLIGGVKVYEKEREKTKCIFLSYRLSFLLILEFEHKLNIK